MKGPHIPLSLSLSPFCDMVVSLVLFYISVYLSAYRLYCRIKSDTRESAECCQTFVSSTTKKN